MRLNTPTDLLEIPAQFKARFCLSNLSLNSNFSESKIRFVVNNGETTGINMLHPDLTNFDQLPDAANVSVQIVAGLFGCKIPTIWARLRRKEIPEPRRFGSHTRWNVGELREALKGEAI